jgi:zinc finger SWIM domain-containing protein 3
MSGKRPVSVFIDQCAAIGKAIEKVLPSTMHFLCLWHIYQNAAKHLSHVISTRPRFLADFKKVVYLKIQCHTLSRSDKTKRSEGMNNVFKKQFRKKLCLSEFLVQYENCSASLRENELYADFKSRKTTPVTYVRNLPMLKTAAESYTRRLYSDFEEQFKQQFFVTCELISDVGTVRTYKVKPVAIEDEALVVFNYEDLTISCSCRRYESKGMQLSFI